MLELPASVTAEQLQDCAYYWERYGELPCPPDCLEYGVAECVVRDCPPDPLAAWLRTLADEI